MSQFQSDWRWCHKCEALFFAGHPTKGRCPADGGSHDASQSGAYETRLGSESAAAKLAPDIGAGGDSSAQQGDWRWCHKCEGLFFAGHPSKGRCPADRGSHDASQSGHYAVLLDDGKGNERAQNSWRWCHKCEGLFFAGHPSKGRCPADGGSHDASQSGAYKVEGPGF
jgi:hypothetical protein